MPSKLNSDSCIPIARNSNINRPMIENNVISRIDYSDNSIMFRLILSTEEKMSAM